ncbi:ABC transporter substrate-binding protein [Capillibacterium thermochitinicola]|uniref:Extracellular solute-binding protein n=1 Tax=Capillibacterium thermochitinicola TaxID=2699427 RepID=A0A8J6I1T7_9FIRM|nr:extracellular solute-binding protein [Capillibacterium thermochitinicola]MBA2133871.1 extracellular solute-binding protein [Capillibacterium thermochitinicola]
MRKGRKVLFLLLSVALLNGVLFGTVYAAKPVKLVFWGALPPEAGPQQVIENYKKVAPHVTIEYVRYLNDDQGNIKLDTALLAGEEIDIFTSYGVNRREQRVKAGMAADLTDLCKKYGVDLIRDFGPGAAANIVDGKVYSIPTMTIINFIALNKDMFDEAGIPIPEDWTLDEFRAIAKKLTKGEGPNKVYGIIGDYNVNIMSFLPTKLNGTPYLKEDMSGTTWKSIPDFRRGFQLLYDMMYVDKSMMSWEDVLTQKLTNTEALAAAFFSGRSAMMVTGTYMLRNIKDTEKYPRNFTVAFAPKPKVDKDQKIYYKDQMPHDDMMIPPRSTKKEEAFKFIIWYATQGYDPMIENGRPPLYTKYDPQKAAALLLKGAEGIIDVDSFAKSVLAPADHIKEDKVVRQMAELERILREEQEAYYLNVIDLDTLLDNLQRRMDQVLQSGR